MRIDGDIDLARHQCRRRDHGPILDLGAPEPTTTSTIDTETANAPDTTTASTTDAAPAAVCGDGLVEGDEGCDLGPMDDIDALHFPDGPHDGLHDGPHDGCQIIAALKVLRSKDTPPPPRPASPPKPKRSEQLRLDDLLS